MLKIIARDIYNLNDEQNAAYETATLKDLRSSLDLKKLTDLNWHTLKSLAPKIFVFPSDDHVSTMYLRLASNRFVRLLAFYNSSADKGKSKKAVRAGS